MLLVKFWRRSIYFVLVVFVVTFVIAISANPKYDVFEIMETFESECVGNAKTKM